MSRVAYVIRFGGKAYLGIARYSYAEGRYAPTVTFDHARIFNRRSDADAARKTYGGEVVTVTIHQVK